jgi:16S rRNA (guanine527-N7)-methyltransferase
LEPYLKNGLPDQAEDIFLYEGLERYLDLLLKWNAKTNLTAVRDEKGIVQRHFGESLFLVEHLPKFGTLLDFGSGAGFPGIPIQLKRPSAVVTLAESQMKKASFLREAVRTLLLAAEVWDKRVEKMPAERVFDVVTMRAVDDMPAMLPLAAARVRQGGTLALMLGREETLLPEDFHWGDPIPVPLEGGVIRLGTKRG